jgi:hypothetical protein
VNPKLTSGLLNHRNSKQTKIRTHAQLTATCRASSFSFRHFEEFCVKKQENLPVVQEKNHHVLHIIQEKDKVRIKVELLEALEELEAAFRSSFGSVVR